MGIPIISDLVGGVRDLISESIVDKDKKLEIDFKLKELEDQANARADEQLIQQIEVNKIEAASGSLFVAGWRPFIGWVGGLGLATQSIVLPLVSQITNRVYNIDTELLLMTILSMLGVGGMRTLEKIKGVSTNDYRDTPTAPVVVKDKSTKKWRL